MNKKLAIVQMEVAFGDPKVNFATVHRRVTEAAEHGAEIILLPELWDTGYDLARFDVLADKNAHATIEFLSDLAQSLNVSIVGGTVAEQTDDGHYNTMPVINQNGDLVHKYAKLHLFQLMDEDMYLTEGQNDPAFELAGIPSAGYICYDIRFPEWVRKSAVGGAKVLYVVAEWPKPRIDHWRTLLQARAIENQCYVVACNRVGEDPNNTFGGNSMVIDPWGQIVAEGGTDEETMITDIDPDKVDSVRRQIPIFEDRREARY